MRHRNDAGALAVLLLLVSAPARAQWPVNGVPLTTSPTSPTTHAVCADGSGGIIAAWSELRNGQYDILAGRATAPGISTWPSGGAQVSVAAFDQVTASVCPDGAGGAIVAWRDQRSGGGFDIYAQRIDANGLPVWTKDGVAVCTVSNNQYAPVVVSDGSGGAIVVWYDYRALNYDIYAQRMDANGNALWTGGGIAIYAGAGSQHSPMAVTDGAGGAVVAWTDIRNGNADIFARRVSNAGTVSWSTLGVALCTHPSDQLDPVLVADGTGGAIVAWRDIRNGTWDVFAQRVGVAGTTLWTANGVPVCTAALEQLHPVIACDGAGGAIVAWDDARGSSVDIYVQRLDGNGGTLWAPNGIAVCTAANGQTQPSLVCDGAGVAMVAWEDRRAGNADIYAQGVNANGTTQWTANGVAVCTASSDQLAPLAVADGFGGVALAWKDTRAGNVDVYAHRLGASGGTPTPVDKPAHAPALVVSDGYPNPFAETVRFGVESHGATVAMDVFDVAGRRVAQRAVRGNDVAFDGRDDRGRRIPGGIYFCRFTANGTTVTRKIVIAR